MDPARKGQANNVVYVAQSADHATGVTNHFASDPRVRVLDPSSGMDTGRVFNGVTGGANAERLSPRLGGRFFGIAGYLMPFAQTNSYAHTYGVERGFIEMTTDAFDPFGFRGYAEPPADTGGVCDPSSGNCTWADHRTAASDAPRRRSIRRRGAAVDGSGWRRSSQGAVGQ